MSNPKRKARYKRKLKREWQNIMRRPIGYFAIQDRKPGETSFSLEDITQRFVDSGATVVASYRWEVPVSNLLYPEMANKTLRYVPLEP